MSKKLCVIVVLAALTAAFSGHSMVLAQPAEADSGRTSESFDLLLAPASPGFVLLGIAPTAVERPGTPSDLAMTVLNNTRNFSALPENFALEFSPYWLFFGQNIGYSSYAADNVGSNIAQTLSFSIATTSDAETSTDPTSTSLGIGVRFSLLRGSIDQEFNDYAKKLETLYSNLGEISLRTTQKRAQMTATDTTIRKLVIQLQSAEPAMIPLIETALAQKQSAIDNQAEAEVREELRANYDKLQAIATGLRLRRIGWKLDLAGGFVVDFPQSQFDNGSLNRTGAWLTGGYEWTNFSFLSLARYLGGHDDSNNNSIDLGGRLILDNVKKFSLSAESVYRSFPDRDSDKSEYRLAFSLDYAIAKNKALSFSFGRDFEGKQSGNLISMINLILGFGSERPFAN